MKNILLSAFTIIMMGLDAYAGSANPQKICTPTPFNFEVSLDSTYPKASDDITNNFFDAFVNTVKQINVAPGGKFKLYPFDITKGVTWPFRFLVGDKYYSPGDEIEIPVNTEGWNKQLKISGSGEIKIAGSKAFGLGNEDYSIFVTYGPANDTTSIFAMEKSGDDVTNMFRMDNRSLMDILTFMNSPYLDEKNTIRGWILGTTDLEITKPYKAAGVLSTEYSNNRVLPYGAREKPEALMDYFSNLSGNNANLVVQPAFATACADYTVDPLNNPNACADKPENTSTCSLIINDDGSIYYENGCCSPGYSLSIKPAE